MKQFAAVFSFMVLCLGLTALAKEKDADFSGNWKLNVEKSDAVAKTTYTNRGGFGGGMGGGGFGGGMGGMGGGGFGGGMGGMGGGGFGGGMGGMGGGGFGGGMGGGMGRGGMGRGGMGQGGTYQRATNEPMVIKQSGKEITITTIFTMNGQNTPITETFTLDGKKHEETGAGGQEQEIKANLRYSTMKIEIETKGAQGKTKRKREFNLSHDGNTLTLKVNTESPTSKTEQKFIYEKQ